MMKQTERLETMWQETLNRFIQSEYCPYGFIFNSKIEIDIEGYSKGGFYVCLCDAFLMNTKMDFENEMIDKYVHITANKKMNLRIILEYTF